jgi:beta-galactosidase
VFREVAELGRDYEKLTPLLGSRTRAEVAFVYDWEARWGFELSSGPMSGQGEYERVSLAHYRPYWSRGVAVDVVDSERDWSGYRLLVTPQLFLLKPGVAERLRDFVAGGGTWVATHYTAYCDEHNRLFVGGLPGAGLGEVLGIWNEEVDALRDGMRLRLERAPAAGPGPETWAERVCEVVHLRGARALLSYAEDFYAGHPALSVNDFGRGRAYYHAARLSDPALDDFHAELIRDLGLERSLPGELPPGVSARCRRHADQEFLFLLNFNAEPVRIDVGPAPHHDLIEARDVSGPLELAAFGARILRRVPGNGAR